VAIKVIELANNPDASMIDISDHVALDPALAAKMLKVAGSALYQTRVTPANVRQAVNLLGTHAAIMIALSFSLTNSFRKQSDSAMDRTMFWRRSFLSALACRALGAKQGSTTLDHLFLAGLLQDIGILAFDTMLPDAYADVLAAAPNHEALLDAERAAFGAGHDEVGDWLLKRWNLPASLSQACLASHLALNIPGTLSATDACVLVSGRIADVLLTPGDPACAALAVEAAQRWLALDANALSHVFDTIGAELKAVEELFDISILQPAEVAAILAEAKELLVIHTMNKMRGLEEKSQRDALTGAHNRGFFDDALKREFALATRHGWPLSIALIDIDRFKAVNDTYGHPAGDAVLGAVTRAILGQIRQGDVLARYGGDEFAVIFPSTSLESSLPLLERLKSSIAALSLQQDDGQSITVTASIGVATHMDGELRFAQSEDLMKGG